VTRICQCHEPTPKPQKPGVCVQCGAAIEGDWVCDDRQVGEFFGRLADTFPGNPPPELEEFRIATEARERAGRGIFGFEYVHKNLVRNGREECSDAFLYAVLECLQDRRKGIEPQEDIALMIGHHAVEIWRLFGRMRDKERGAP